ncbi:prepilin-type N-terminal cleavage/methylation domain-containing protein [bacterium]|nr:MAG: prepilin-type N-terminal cleavage/methylation domain-containing protein [bacterium]
MPAREWFPEGMGIHGPLPVVQARRPAPRGGESGALFLGFRGYGYGVTYSLFRPNATKRRFRGFLAGFAASMALGPMLHRSDILPTNRTSRESVTPGSKPNLVPYMIKSRLSARGRRGFTLVELLVVVLILAILMAVALPLYVSSVNDANKKTCRANMQSIANAAQAWKVKNRKTDFSTLTAITDLEDDLGAEPKTPSGGAYTLVAAGGSVNDEGGAATTVPAGSIGIDSGTECNGFIPGVMTK